MSSISFIKELISQQEPNTLEFVTNWDNQFILKTICAFLNTNGGWIISGYNKLGLTNIPNITPHEIDTLKKDALDNIFPQPLIYVHSEIIEGKTIVLLNVLKGSRPPYSYMKKYFIRKEDDTIEATPDDVSLILRSPNQYTSNWEKLTTIDASYTDLNEREILKTIEAANTLGKIKSLPQDPVEFLSYFQLTDYSTVKNGAILLYGIRPASFFSNCRIRIINMPDGATSNNFSDTKIIEENLFISFENIIDYFRKNIPIVSDFLPNVAKRIDREQYPFEALDEAIVNAIVHRDYGDMSGDITINIHKNKIEIINSGEIPSDIIKRKNKIASHHSVLRNPTIAHMFFLRGNMEKLGRGLSLIKKQFDDIGLKSPEWTSQSGYTKLTLFGIKKDIKLNQRMIRFLVEMMPENYYSSEDYSDFFMGDIKERTARMDIQKLIEGGWIKKTGDGPQTRYKRTDKNMPDTAG
ncbi:MAG: RNA-binding domain-containing protein [Bacteroidota bacterium]